MSRREYVDRFDERESEFYRRPRRERDYEELDVDITRSRQPDEGRSRVSRAPRAETVVKERETVIDERRGERGPRQPDFLREDYGRTAAGPLVVTERREDVYSRAPTKRRSNETVRPKAPERVEKEEFVFREKERERGLPYARGERDFTERDEIIFRDQVRERPKSRPPRPRERSDEEIDIKIKRTEDVRLPPPRSEAPSRSEFKEVDFEEIRFRRGGGERPPPPRTEVEKEEIRFTETRSPPPREYRGRERETVTREEIDIREERSAPPPRARSISRPALIARDREEWIVRRPRKEPSPPPRDWEKEEIVIRRKERSPSPEPPPPPPVREVEKEQIIIRRKERSLSPEPPREPTPEPPPAPIIRPPIIQEVITHHRHIDHGIERARSPTPPPPPPAASPPREEELEIEIRRQGTRNGKFYDEDIIFEKDVVERKNRDEVREVSRRRSVSASARRRSPSPRRRMYEDDVTAEADFYNRRVRDRSYAGEAWNGATRDWGLVDIPPGTERVRMDGKGGGRQEITWERYNGERRAKFYTGDRLYETPYGNGMQEVPPAPISPPSFEREGERVTETRITERRITEDTTRGRAKDKMWTEITKDLVTKEAIEESGYEYEETDEFFYVMEYLRYVSISQSAFTRSHLCCETALLMHIYKF